jgi:hypothetical protein
VKAEKKMIDGRMPMAKTTPCFSVSVSEPKRKLRALVGEGEELDEEGAHGLDHGADRGRRAAPGRRRRTAGHPMPTSRQLMARRLALKATAMAEENGETQKTAKSMGDGFHRGNDDRELGKKICGSE